MLQTNSSGVLSFVDAPSGDLVLLSRVQASGTASEVAFDNVFSTTYTRYLLSIGQCSVDTDTADIRIQWTDNSGSRYTGGHYTGAGKRRDAGNGTDYNQSYIGSASVVIAGDNNNSPNTPAMFHGFIYNNTISDTTDRCILMGNRVYHSSARHDPMFGFFGASFSQAASVYGFDVFANTGNLEDYDIAIYGLKIVRGNMSYKYKNINGKLIELTSEEIAELEARDKAWQDENLIEIY